MTEASEPSKIVNLNQRADSALQRGGELLNAVRGIASRRLQQLLEGMFEHVDDALFDLAEKAENNAVQMHYFDGMREVRKRRPMIERGYLGQVARDLANIGGQGQDQAGGARSPAPPAAGSGIELALVADNELEESLAITSMISKNESRLARDLFAVNQRLSVICGGLKIDDATNPVAPAALSHAFNQALRELSADMRVKLIIYKLFDRYVLSGLEELYQEINAELVRAGVLPQLRQSAGQPARPTAAAVTAAAAAYGEQVAGGGDETAAAENLLLTLHQLFIARRGMPPPTGRATTGGHAEGGAAPASSGPAPTANELLGALSVLQSQLANSSALAAPSTVDTASLALEVAELKNHLLGQIGALRGERPGQVASMDEDTIDLVGMLFQFILEDDNLPAEMQVMLARLQIPYLKASILDRRVFAHRQHPARRLLDGLAEMAKGWSPESDRDHRVHDKVKAIVEQLLHDFDDDLGIFERLYAELQSFQELVRKRAELAEQRVAESTRGRERLEQARRRAAREILDRIGEHSLPPLIHGVLTRAWANYLVLTILRQGEDSLEFADALRFVNDFIASTRPARDPESLRALRQLLPGIERSLRRGLTSVAFQDSDIERLLGRLHTYYRQQLGELPAEPAPEEAAPLPIPESIQPIVEQEAPALQAEREAEVAPPPDLPELELVHSLKPGTWLELASAAGTAERAKLSWISPMSGRYLFVNRRGLKVADYAPHELAALIAEGQARVLAAEPLFDRAMDAIVGKLSQNLSTPETSPAA